MVKLYPRFRQAVNTSRVRAMLAIVMCLVNLLPAAPVALAQSEVSATNNNVYLPLVTSSTSQTAVTDEQPITAASDLLDAGTTVDQQGPDDVSPSRTDLSSMSFDASHVASTGIIYVQWNYDDTVFTSGSNINACALFDTTGGGGVNYAVCAEIGSDGNDALPNTGVLADVDLWDCTDVTASPLNCTGGGGSGADGSGAELGDKDNDGINDSTATGSANEHWIINTAPGYKTQCSISLGDDPFASNLAHQANNSEAPDDAKDIVVLCTIYVSDFVEYNSINPTSATYPKGTHVGGLANLTNVCSYPASSGEPGSDAKDCVVSGGAGFITVVKNIDGGTPDDTFAFTLNGSAFTSITTSGGTGSTLPLPKAPGTYNLAETVDPDWNLLSATCSDGSLPGALALSAGERVTCTFTNKLSENPPSILVTKTADPISVNEPGGSVTFTVAIENTSDATDPITITTLSDNVYGNLDGKGTCDVPQTIQPGATYTCSFSETVSGDAGYSHTNRVTASGTDNEGVAVSDDDDATVTVTDVLPTVKLEKTAVPTNLSEPGGSFVFTLTVKNTSVENVTITALTDSQSGATNFSACTALVGTSLTPGESVSCQYTVNHTDTGVYNNTANVTVKDNEDNEASDTANAMVNVDDVLPTVSLEKIAYPTTLSEPGGNFVFTLTVKNTSVENVTITALTDDQSSLTNFSACTALVGRSLTPGESVFCQYTVSHTDAGQYENNASVTVKDNEDNRASDTANATVNVDDVLPTVSLEKIADPTILSEPGGNFVFTLTVKNTSVENVTITALTDDQSSLTNFSACTALVGRSLTPGESVFCQYTVSHTDAGKYENNASVTVKDNEDNLVSDDATATVNVTDALPTVSLEKIADPTTLSEPGGNFVFTLTVKNTSVENVTITALTDSQSTATDFSTCSVLVNKILAPDESVFCQYTVSHTDARKYDNTANVTVKDNEGNSVSDEAKATVNVTDELPTVSLEKIADPTMLSEPGGNFVFTLTVKNTSVENVTITALTDDQSGATDFSACSALVNKVLAPDESASCQYTVSHTNAGVYNNTANVTVTDNEGNEAIDNASMMVQVGDKLPMVELEKIADPMTLSEPGGNFVFTLTVKNTSVEDVTITALTDSQSGVTDFSTCSALVNKVLAPDESVFCQYTVSHTDAGSYDNTANVTVKDNDGNSVSDEAKATVNVTDALPTVSLEKIAYPTTLSEPGGNFVFTLTVKNTSVENVTITALTDSQSGATDFSTCSALVNKVLVPDESVSCQYTLSHTNAGSYDNDASVTVKDNEGNLASDKATATVNVIDVLPTVSLEKIAYPTTLSEPGGNFVFTLTVKNTSVENVTITALTDSQSSLTNFSACTALVGRSLTPGESVSCQYTVNHSDTGAYENKANVTVEDNEGNSVSDDAMATVNVTDVLPTVSLEKIAYPMTLSEPGGNFVFTLTVKNTSVENVTITDLTDTQSSLTNFFACTALVGRSLTPGESVFCQYTVSHTDAGSYDNDASVTVKDNENNTTSDDAMATVNVTDALPTVTLEKIAYPTTLSEPGGNFVFTLTVKNTSVENVTITALTDSQSGATNFSTCSALVNKVLAPNESASCQYTVSHTNAGSYDNTANVTVKDNENNTASDEDMETVKVNDVLPDITVIKTAASDSVPEIGGSMVFTFEVINNSLEEATIKALSDDKFGTLAGDADCKVGTVLAGEASCSFTATLNIPAGDYPNKHVNTFTATVSDDEGNEDDATESETVGYSDVKPDITVIKTAASKSISETGGSMVFTFEVTNNSPEAATIKALSDDKFGTLAGDADCKVGTVLAGEAFCSFTATFAIPAGDFPGSHINTFTATGEDDDGNSDSGSDDETVNYTDVKPDITVTKTAASSSVSETGDSMVFTFVVKNNSTEAAEITALSDNKFGTLTGDDDCKVGTVLAGGASCSFTATFAIPAGDYPGSHVNIFTATGADDDGNSDTGTEDETVTYTDVLPDITVTKTAASDSVSETGGSMAFTFVVKNNSTEAATIKTLSDNKFGTLAGDDDCKVGIVLAGGASCTFSATLVIPVGNAGTTHVNTFTATGEDNDNNSDGGSDDETVTYANTDPAITIIKTVDANADGTFSDSEPLLNASGTATYTYQVTNSSPAASVDPLTITSLVDDRGTASTSDDKALVTGGVLQSGVTLVKSGGDQDALLESGETWTYTLAIAVTFSTGTAMNTNVATVSARDDEGTSASDDDTASVRFVDYGQLAPTGVTCPQYVSGTSPDFSTFYASQGGVVQYGLKGTKINSTNPGVFFYYTGLSKTITGPGPVFIDQSDNNTNIPAFAPSEVKLWLVTGTSCTQVQLPAGAITISNGDVTVNIPSAAPTGSYYVVSVKYDTSSVVGSNASGKPTVKYTFTTSVNGTIQETDLKGITLAPKR